jgi:hypothetical protein
VPRDRSEDCETERENKRKASVIVTVTNRTLTCCSSCFAHDERPPSRETKSCAWWLDSTARESGARENTPKKRGKHSESHEHAHAEWVSHKGSHTHTCTRLTRALTCAFVHTDRPEYTQRAHVLGTSKHTHTRFLIRAHRHNTLVHICKQQSTTQEPKIQNQPLSSV